MGSISKFEALLENALLLDIETTRGGKIRHVGAVYRNECHENKNAPPREALAALDRFSKDARFVLGHNLFGFDFPVLRAAAPGLSFLNKPIIDTLYLSPLAFPRNPYHRLVKDYKLVRASLSDPVADARLAASVFADQFESFAAMAGRDPHLLPFYRFCFEDALFKGFPGTGFAVVFGALGAERKKNPQIHHEYFREKTKGIVCESALPEVLPRMLDDPAGRPAAAYCLAWLQVSGSNSVLPPWVRHSFPEIADILKTLRERPCGRPGCAWCREEHDPEKALDRFFGFSGFRENPKTEAGESLQRAVVIDGMRDRPLLAILPTGGGKSLCYQLPALVRNRRRGVLTIVVSPLQALMKDQVDNLAKSTGTPFAEAVYGLQTQPERGAVLERIRMGDVAILYIAPEQLRSRSVIRAIKQREIGCWVFDEAHCLSKWGHDFRPDYLYAARFIRELAREQNREIPPVCCYTATAKIEVIEEIASHFRTELDLDLERFEGGIERENLVFEVLPAASSTKLERTFDLLQGCLKDDDSACAIVYAATRSGTEEIRDFLRGQGMRAEAFHGGLDPHLKREIMDGFVAGNFRVICATNAFGLGIDKGNIRLVLHFEMPGSLENYIQEAGRAGRDRRLARCVLLYDPKDAERQFGLGALSEVKKEDIERVLRALRRAKRNKRGEIVITGDELLRDEEFTGLREERKEFAEKKVKTAVSWLERAGFLHRDQNLTDLFQGKPLVGNLDAASKIIETLRLPEQTARLWLRMLQILFNSADDRGISADSIAEGLFPDLEDLKRMEKATGLTPAQIVISALHDMADAGLLDRGLMLSAVLRPKGKNSAPKILEGVCDLEKRLVSVMQAEDPDADDGGWVELNINRLTQKLKNEGFETAPPSVRSLLKGLSNDGKGLSASLGSLELQHLSRDHYKVKLQRTWDVIKRTAALRHGVAYIILKTLIEKSEAAGGNNTGGEVAVSFSSNELSAAIASDIALRVEVKKILPAIEHALMFLHEQKAITLQGGLAVLRQAMTIRLAPESRRRYTLGDFKPLAVHYAEKRFQVHVMMEYGRLGAEKIAGALRLVFDYFSLGRNKFIAKYFADRREMMERATTRESYRRIVEQLGNPVQIAAVGSPPDRNLLILAGPGSGKTTVIVHRCAYLLQVERIPPRRILILCFNHNSAVGLRKRLSLLAGKEAAGVTVATYHGAGMRITGHSVRDMMEPGKGSEIDFERMIRDAVRLLKGEADIPGLAPDEARDRLLAGYSHILVDEYQDIDELQYDLVSAIAGRTLEEEAGRLSILAVGDDDQNIYAFRGANIEFIRRFREDYAARTVYLVENYRSSKHIIQGANDLIARNRDRMKGSHPIRIDRHREGGPPGGRWCRIDAAAEGRVQIVSVKDRFHQAIFAASELKRLRSLSPDLRWDDCAILARTREVLPPVRSVLEHAGIPFKTSLESSLPLDRVREVSSMLDRLRGIGAENRRASDLLSVLSEVKGEKERNIWWMLLEDFFESYRDETADAVLPASRALDRLYEFLAEQRQEKVLGRGIFLSTIHAAKGMEFGHVAILGGDWIEPGHAARAEEERRTLYVGMTRGRETLLMMDTLDRPNPLLSGLSGESFLRRSASAEPQRQALSFKRYAFFGLKDLYIDYAAGFPEDHPIHRHIERLEAGDSVSLAASNSRVEVHDAAGCCIARLSSEAAEKWCGRLSSETGARIVAVMRRYRKDSGVEFEHRIQADAWEFPLLEVRF